MSELLICIHSYQASDLEFTSIFTSFIQKAEKKNLLVTDITGKKTTNKTTQVVYFVGLITENHLLYYTHQHY